MILEIEHVLTYSYSAPVSLNPHYLYLTPKPSPYQQILDHQINISPKPSYLVKNLDQEDNLQHVCYFQDKHEVFEVGTYTRINTEDFNTLDFVLYPFEAAKMPINYRGKLGVFGDKYIANKVLDSEVLAYGKAIADRTNYKTMDFLMEVCKCIKKDFSYVSRERGDAESSLYTLQHKEGSCRDFSVLMMDICASFGILARFVSGYLFGSELHEHDLHAWVEVLLPGGGWRGFDPTEGQVVNKNYIALASSIEPLGLNPVRGTFRGPQGVESVLKTKVKIAKKLY